MSDFILPPSAKLVDPINDSECNSLGNNTGLDIDDGENTCQAIQQRLMPLLAQIVSDISSGVMTIYANDESKCDDNDDPTLASMMSRIYRVSQAFACVLCQYDPTLSNMLMAGTYPQVLMGKQNPNGYPGWVSPDTSPTSNSKNLVTSGGIYTAIQNALMSSWHMWKLPAAQGSTTGVYNYLVTDLADLPTTGIASGEWAVYHNVSGRYVETYTVNNAGTQWVSKKRFNYSQMENFGVIHVMKGKWADKGLYWFENGWNLLNAELDALENRMDALEQQYDNVVTVETGMTNDVKIGIVNTLTEADAIQPEAGMTKLIFIKEGNNI